MTFGSLFAGIGGIDLGLERAGMSCAWQVEIDPWCRRVLAKHWPHVQRFDDVKTFAIKKDEALRVDCIAGGFPCQDVSDAGHKRGLAGERSGLWSEFARIIRVLRPAYILVENVAALLKPGRGLGEVLRDLALLGYDAEWHLLSAAAFGFPHNRRRVFVVANAAGERRPTINFQPRGLFAGSLAEQGEWQRIRPSMRESGASHANRVRLLPVGFDGRSDDGIPHRLDRIRGLGNAVVPACAEHVGRAIVAAASRNDNA